MITHPTENGGDGDCSKGVAKRPHHFLHDQPFEERKKAPFSLLDALKSKLPFLEWLPAYRFPDVFSDAVAGVTVGLTVIPQGIAYALLANLPPQVHFIRTPVSEVRALKGRPIHSTGCTRPSSPASSIASWARASP